MTPRPARGGSRGQPTVHHGIVRRQGLADQWRRLENGTYAAMFLLIALVFSTRLDVQFSLPKLLVIRTFVPVLGVLWLIRFTRAETRSLPRAVWVPAAVLAAWWALTTVTAVHPPTALNGAHGRYNGLWNQLLALSMCLIVASTRFSVADVERLARYLVASLVPVSCYALVQYAGWDPFTWPTRRSASTIGNPVILAALLGLVTPFALVFLIAARKRAERWWWGAALALLLGGMISTLSRGPLASSAAGVLMVVAALGWEYRGRLNRLLVAGTVAVAVVAMAAGYSQIAQMRQGVAGAPAADTEESVLVRLHTYSAALRIVRDHPVTGVGLENFAAVYPRYRSASSERLTPDVLPTMVHNGYLQAAATTGMPGLLAYLAFMASVLIVLVRAYMARNDRRERLLILAFIASIAGYLIQDLLGWLEVSLSAFFWIVIGLGLALASASRPPAAVTPLTRRLTAVAVGAAALGAGVLAVETAEVVRVDYLISSVRGLGPRDNWPAIESALASALASPVVDAAYLDKAGVRYANRYAASGALNVYARAASLFDQAHGLDPFNPYFRIHRLSLETLAIEKKAATPDIAEALASDLLALDSNNAAVHEGVARLRLAQGRTDDARQSVSKAHELRPSSARYDELRGDIDRAMNSRVAAVEAYRSAVAQFMKGDTTEWMGASHKMILVLLEVGQNALAVEEARRLVNLAPGDGVGHSLLGYALLAIKDSARASEAFEAALRIAPGDQSAKQGLAQAHAMNPG